MGKGVKIGWFIIFVFLGYLILIGIRLAKIYINDYHLREIIKKETIMYVGESSKLISRIVKKAKNSNIPIEKEAISIIRRKEEHAVFHIEYGRSLDGIFFKHKINFDYQLKARLF